MLKSPLLYPTMKLDFIELALFFKDTFFSVFAFQNLLASLKPDLVDLTEPFIELLYPSFIEPFRDPVSVLFSNLVECKIRFPVISRDLSVS